MDSYWILNAPGHRLAENEQIVVAIAEYELHSPGVEHIVIGGDEDWVCDSCNGAIPVFLPDGVGGPDPTRLAPEGRLRPVPVVDGDVLCPRCFFGRSLDPRVVALWPGCGCPPCRDAAGIPNSPE